MFTPCGETGAGRGLHRCVAAWGADLDGQLGNGDQGAARGQ